MKAEMMCNLSEETSANHIWKSDHTCKMSVQSVECILSFRYTFRDLSLKNKKGRGFNWNVSYEAFKIHESAHEELVMSKIHSISVSMSLRSCLPPGKHIFLLCFIEC
jgi:predicted secreted Zn-dependent protease